VLILTRRTEEAVTITCPDGQQVVVRVLGISEGAARLGFEAPDDYQILRDNARFKQQRGRLA
jgi:carbon storage regulator CsrA